MTITVIWLSSPLTKDKYAIIVTDRIITHRCSRHSIFSRRPLRKTDHLGITRRHWLLHSMQLLACLPDFIREIKSNSFTDLTATFSIAVEFGGRKWRRLT